MPLTYSNSTGKGGGGNRECPKKTRKEAHKAGSGLYGRASRVQCWLTSTGRLPVFRHRSIHTCCLSGITGKVRKFSDEVRKRVGAVCRIVCVRSWIVGEKLRDWGKSPRSESCVEDMTAYLLAKVGANWDLEGEQDVFI